MNANSSTKPLQVLVANGVNLDLLGTREPNIYGALTLGEIEKKVKEFVAKVLEPGISRKIEMHWFQSNDECAYLNKISDPAYDLILCNPGAWTHTSLALADRLRAIKRPYAEVHLSNVAAREPIRQFSMIAASSSGAVHGFGWSSYCAALTGLVLST